MTKRYLVTSALPYANGVVHLGHIAGAYLPADLYCRWRRMRGDEVLFICGNDDHGVPITIAAEKEGITPQALTDRYYEINSQAFRDLGIEFDIFSRTSAPEHAAVAQGFFTALYEAGDIYAQDGEQFYCEKCARYLPDRYVEGVCPECGAEGARGDQCDACGKWYESLTLKQPYCRDCKATPVVRPTRHWYFALDKYEDRLRQWLDSRENWREKVLNFAKGWVNEGLRPRAITRDIDWGVPVPLDEAAGKVLYVWFDAPIGYITFTQQYYAALGDPDGWKQWWQDDETDLIHFIGKDNIVFHALVFPATLMGRGGYVLPANVPANEFLTFGGEKGSKSKGNAITVPEYLQQYPADLLRYYLTINAPEVKDANFTWDDFAARNNDELADVFGNLYHRIQTFAHKYFDGAMPAAVPLDAPVLRQIRHTKAKFDALVGNCEIREAMREVLALARWGNKFFDDEKPWASRKDDIDRCAAAIAACLELCAALAVLTWPCMPFSAQKLWEMLALDGDIDTDGWKRLGEPVFAAGHKLNKPEILFRKIETVLT